MASPLAAAPPAASRPRRQLATRASWSRLLQLALFVCLTAGVGSRPASSGASAKRSRREAESLLETKLRSSPPAHADELDADEEFEDDGPAAPGPSSPPRRPAKPVRREGKARLASSGKGSRRASRRKAAAPSAMEQLGVHAASLWSAVSERTSQLTSSVSKAMVEQKGRAAAAAEEQREAQLRQQAAARERIRKLREEADGLGGRQRKSGRGGEAAAAEEEAEGDGGERAEGAEVPELTLAERGAIAGSVLLSPSGIAGVVVGGALGGAAGFVADQVEGLRAHVASAYSERLATENEIKESISATSDRLKGLQKISVVAAEKAEAERSAAELTAFVRMRANQQCADCGVDIDDVNGAWASLNLKVVVCVRCAGVHRSLGASTSRIKSVVYDKWDPAMVSALLEGGNARAREWYLQRLPEDFVAPTEDSSDAALGAHIRDKYVKLKWADPKVREEHIASAAARRATASSAVAYSKPVSPLGESANKVKSRPKMMSLGSDSGSATPVAESKKNADDDLYDLEGVVEEEEEEEVVEVSAVDEVGEEEDEEEEEEENDNDGEGDAEDDAEGEADDEAGEEEDDQADEEEASEEEVEDGDEEEEVEDSDDGVEGADEEGEEDDEEEEDEEGSAEDGDDEDGEEGEGAGDEETVDEEGDEEDEQGEEEDDADEEQEEDDEEGEADEEGEDEEDDEDEDE